MKTFFAVWFAVVAGIFLGSKIAERSTMAECQACNGPCKNWPISYKRVGMAHHK